MRKIKGTRIGSVSRGLENVKSTSISLLRFYTCVIQGDDITFFQPATDMERTNSGPLMCHGQGIDFIAFTKLFVST
jgi:hypothetical protein